MHCCFRKWAFVTSSAICWTFIMFPWQPVPWRIWAMLPFEGMGREHGAAINISKWSAKLGPERCRVTVVSVVLVLDSLLHRDLLTPGIILCMCPANGRRRYNVTSSLIGWAHTQNDLCTTGCFVKTLSPQDCYVQVYLLTPFTLSYNNKGISLVRVLMVLENKPQNNIRK